MDTFSETEFITDVYSSPVGSHPSAEQKEWSIQVEKFVDEEFQASKKKATKKQKNEQKSKKGHLENEEEIALWSPAKKQSWEARKTNPNAYYYRHVDPGVVKRTGAWDDEEKELFMKAIKLHPPTQGKWGLFAMHIPGRVGYQCRNFYHRLLETGELHEDCTIGEPAPQKPKKQVTKKKSSTKKKIVEPESEDDDQDEDIIGEDELLQEEEIIQPPKPEPKVFQIRSLKLFSTRVLQEDERLKSEAEEAAREAISSFKSEEENQTPTEIKEENEFQYGVVEDKEATCEEIVEAAAESVERAMPEVLRWESKLDASIKASEIPQKNFDEEIINLNQKDISNESRFASIMRLNSRCPMNLLLFSFPAPLNKKDEYIKAVKDRLSTNTEMKTFNVAIREYFAAKDSSMRNPESRDQICEDFVSRFIRNEI
ncbi:Myb-like DNA-binding domain containing protein [Trichomonas vaginalis G3]|uniref:Myb-like DNA-binding domain containing protein n=2 Tax=Trichomonas vaginalis (strain ATCC PRA-98 / G3) TaxID=412133 RepID=A2F3M2_TRIV3|nr:SANT/SWI3/ADA2/N-CoR/TFIIIB'' DNA-binding domain-containing protein [Trichomonas vaginalis G3]EAY00490.1 Myb-like DNA-binding domain containing protein [Trichomonas vaginalis G3]KAI5520552.1 SANT/SWI3/ADA2/N-CoR/TFIIIB'' DNA-binding domain-containing protein [Trichomonas vaginalis G3]|eukprot:XP_001313419.1 Myb-like DNA-binding domain containing protein [Trichomonas vaginalis G3]